MGVQRKEMANRVKVETYRKEKYVGRGFVEHEPFTSIRALLEITAAEDDFGEYKGERQEKVQAELKVIEYEESDEREGDTFRDWFPYKAGKNAAGTRLASELSSRPQRRAQDAS